jgi:hypothetical protein
VSYKTLFLCAPSPGQLFRYFERNHQHLLSANSLLLSDGVGGASLRCLVIENQATETAPVPDVMLSLGPTLSDLFPPRVTILWRHPPASPEPAVWGFTVWENGQVVETEEHALPPDPKPGFLSRLPGMKRGALPPPDIAWALARKLPIDRVPEAGLRRRIPIIDYVTVAGLDQRNLLVENNPRLYRFPL